MSRIVKCSQCGEPMDLPELKDFCVEDQPKARKLFDLLDEIKQILHPRKENRLSDSKTLQ